MKRCIFLLHWNVFCSFASSSSIVVIFFIFIIFVFLFDLNIFCSKYLLHKRSIVSAECLEYLGDGVFTKTQLPAAMAPTIG